jgi:hypothetical protein
VLTCACADPVSSQQVTTSATGDDEPGDGDTGDGDGDIAGDGDSGDGDSGDGDTSGDGDVSGDGDGSGDGDDTGDGDGWESPDGAVAEDDGGDGEGWSSTDDGGVIDPGPDPDGDGGLPPGGCRTLANNTNSGSFGTTGAVCFVLDKQPATSWEAYFIDGRTVTVNGTVVSKGQMPFPGSAPFTVEFSAGLYDYASWAYW